MLITEPIQLMTGMSAKPTFRDMVVVDLHYSADPIGVTPEIIEKTRRKYGCVQNSDGTWIDSWRWKKEMEKSWTAQNGQMVFEGLENQLAYIRNPLYCMDLEDSRLVRRDRGRLRVYIEPQSRPQGLTSNQEAVRTFGMGMDVSEGVGASDSTIEGMAADTREQAFSFEDNQISPVDLARFAAATARYYNQALICPVRPMHGITVIRTLLDECHYFKIWNDRPRDKVTSQRASALGWAKGEMSSAYLVDPYKDALALGKISIHDSVTLEQHKQYIYDERGRITHQALSHLPEDQRKRHGDKVVGLALAYKACCDLPLFKDQSEDTTVPMFSAQWFRNQEAEKRVVGY